jgi:hypothetical protein
MLNLTNNFTSPYLLFFEIAQKNLTLYCRENKNLCSGRKRMLKKEQTINKVEI